MFCFCLSDFNGFFVKEVKLRGKVTKDYFYNRPIHLCGEIASNNTSHEPNAIYNLRHSFETDGFFLVPVFWAKLETFFWPNIYFFSFPLILKCYGGR